jgi:hypothetical protein
MSKRDKSTPSPDPGAEASPELERVLCDLQSSDDWTRAAAVRALCPCRRKDWGGTVFRYVWAMRDDPSPIVRGAVQHDLTENRWNENWEARLIQERRARRRKVTVALKATTLAGLCDHLRSETGVPLLASGSVGTAAVTLFCRQMPLRNVTRQIEALGYAWAWHWNKESPSYFELVRETRSQSAAPDGRRVRDSTLRSRVSLSLSARKGAAGQAVREEKITSADLLEALHRATGLPILADHDARLIPVAALSLRDRPLAVMLDHIAETSGLEWQFADGTWLQFRRVRTLEEWLRASMAARQRRDGRRPRSE